MKKYITLVFEYETDKKLDDIRNAAHSPNCRVWSMDHEMLRADLMRQAIEDGDLIGAERYASYDGVSELRSELRDA